MRVQVIRLASAAEEVEIGEAELSAMEGTMTDGRIEGVAMHRTQPLRQVVALCYGPPNAEEDTDAFPINRLWQRVGTVSKGCPSLRAAQVFLVVASTIHDNTPYRSLTLHALLHDYGIIIEQEQEEEEEEEDEA